MIVHLDSGDSKPIEQKVNELILKKLYIKVDDDKIFIDKEDFIALILKDIIALAVSDCNIDLALSIAIQAQTEYKTIIEVKRNELKETLTEFEVEIDAYKTYLDDINENISEDEIYMDVLLVLNSEHELLEKKLHELIINSLRERVSEEDAVKRNTTRYQLLDHFANQVKLIASYDTIDESVEAAFDEFIDYPKKHLVKKDDIKKEFERFAPLVQAEINVYKLALSLEAQNAEFPMILAMVKQILQIEE